MAFRLVPRSQPCGTVNMFGSAFTWSCWRGEIALEGPVGKSDSSEFWRLSHLNITIYELNIQSKAKHASIVDQWDCIDKVCFPPLLWENGSKKNWKNSRSSSRLDGGNGYTPNDDEMASSLTSVIHNIACWSMWSPQNLPLNHYSEHQRGQCLLSRN